MLLLDFWPLGRLPPAQPARESRKKPIGPVSTRANKGKTGKSPRNTIAGNEYTFGNGLQWASIRPLILEKLPLLGLSTISCIVTYIAQTRSGLPAKIGAFSPGVHIANALVSYVIYIEKMILPVDLAIQLYPHPASLPLWQVLGAALFLVAVTLAVVATAKRFPYLAVGWLWFTGSLVPVIGLVQVGAQAMADRYTYIPSIGLFLMAAWGIPEILGKRSRSAKVLAASSALYLLCIFTLTTLQVGCWRDNITLYDHALKVTENNWLVHSNRGDALHALGEICRGYRGFQ